ncbi:MAG: amino acid permease [Bacteroidia bacterium]|nr:MAG: amino acid permease [Bacteroidia bacterium]
MSLHKIDKWTAIALVVANMVGTGVFTSLGFQLLEIQSAWTIIFLWILGGIIALCGAFTYAEIGSYIIKNGGEYQYLSSFFHPMMGFVAGVVSVVVGFAAPIAAACVAFGKYFSYAFFSENQKELEKFMAILVLSGITGIHLLGLKVGGLFQKYVTLIKIVVMLLFLMAFFLPNANPEIFRWEKRIVDEVFSSAFAVSLIYVSYAYSGWNAAAYISAEIKNPEKILSKALIGGTFLVMMMYVLLNSCFLYSTPVEALKGNVEVGIISAQYIFGKSLGSLIGLLIAGLLVSTISSMMMASPRVLASMGEDFKVISVFNKRNKFHSPYISVLTIAVISMVMIVSSTFQWLINYIGITLIIFTLLTSVGLFVLRKKENYSPVFKVPFYPLPSLVFIFMNLWILVYVGKQEVSALIISVVTIGVSGILYGFIKYLERR